MNNTVPLGALVPLFVAGAVGFASVALLLLVPRNREMRWFSGFNVALVTWLLSRTIMEAGFEIPANDRVWTLAVQLLPGLFIAMALIQLRPARPFWQPAAAVAIGVLAGLVAVVLADGRAGVGADELVVSVWQVAGWLTGVVLLLWAERRRWRTSAGPGPAGLRSFVVGLTTLAPFAVIAASLAGGSRSLTIALPLIILGTYVAIFVGVARLRFYDVEVRVARSGEIATAAAETTRLAALGELAVSFAHEVRNPLTGVRSLAQRLAEDDVADESRRRYAAVILEETGRIDRIVEHMLGIGRRLPAFSTRPGSTDLDALFDDLRVLVSSRAQGAGVVIHSTPSGITAGAGRDALAQALLNLVLNGIAHAPRGTRVTLSGASDAEGTTVSVCDEGPGIPPEERDRIFEPFYSSRPDGSGLGLSVVRTIARQAGWGLEVDDAPGGGTCFRLHVPVPVRSPESVPAPGVTRGSA